MEKSCKYILHSFKMGDVEDPELFAAQPIYEWQQSEQGAWCMKHAKDIHWNLQEDFGNWGYRVEIVGTLSGKHATFYALKRA